ncbi:MAG: alkaline phosphatase PhoX, partial [Bdellovibrionota bacterium]
TTFKTGGKEAGFVCPDNMAFDPCGNLWVTTDISGSEIGRGKYEEFPSNGLYYIPMSGPHAGKSFQVASAPIDAELTGPFFTPDGETLFLSVQHPGENSKTRDALVSHWPDGGDSMPRSAVVAITGPLLKQIQSGTKVPPVFPLTILKG